MPLTPDELYAVIDAATDPDGRLPLSRMTAWEVFPFEPSGLRVVPVARPQVPEPPRAGEDAATCRTCQSDRAAIWSDEHWTLRHLAPSGAPLVLLLESRAHVDLVDLPDERAAELGRLVVHIARAIEELPNIARAHVSRWGDGATHLHLFFFARPAGFSQFRGTCFAIWDDLLPPPPEALQHEDAGAVAARLVQSYGGRSTGP